MISRTQGILLMVLGTMALAASASIIAAIDGEPLSVAAWRCLFAVPMLAPFAWWEYRRHRIAHDRSRGERRSRERSPAGPEAHTGAGSAVTADAGTATFIPRRTIIGATVAGVALGADYSFYNVAIEGIGPGLATVLINLQLVILPLIAWAVDGVRPMRQLAVIVPLMLFGVIMTAGIFAPSASSAPGASGTGVPLSGVLAGIAAGAGYATYLAIIRRTAPTTSRPAPFTVLATVCLSAGLVCLLGAAVSGRLSVPHTAPEWGWLLALALIGQVITYLCFNTAMTAITETASSTLMLLSAVFALAMAAIFFGELPTVWQLVGCALILAGAWWASMLAARHARAVRRLHGTGKP
ncbi:MAG TPA: DMT family transporter [Candidatus Nesterenkonia stercoripullorum]|uniref:DMT family transporter n=1 Tax=Candidatus Nesterenkonia stercoripullorum TaxID=2838701 RepID=A0A9D2A928_9MICC|nr:DMT family transporter [Candidatus Nesterenkonia stercoripullorum]